MQTEQLDKLGFKKASQNLKDKQELKRKMTIAYENFRYMRQEHIDRYNKVLKEKSFKETNQYAAYDKLGFTQIKDYTEIPPQKVLQDMEKALTFECFDYFEVCKIDSVKEIKDPIIFGRIKSCPDRFFISQWDDDVRIEDILKENEG